MNRILTSLALFFTFCAFSQEIITPIAGNPTLWNENDAPRQVRSTGDLDSTFIYTSSTIAITDVWDDFSVNKFVKYPPNYTDGNVTSQWYWCLMDQFNVIPEPDSVKFCDSLHARIDSVFVVAGLGTTFSYYFPPHTIWVNDLSSYPINGQSRTLFDECYVLIDSVIDMVPDPTQDTIWYNDDSYGADTACFTQDSVHLFFADLNDPSQIWLGNQACHNYTMPVDPWSLGVATFDGVDSTGMPYDFGNGNAYGGADTLTSKPVNLNATSNVYLQFIFQAGGHGNLPEDEDSLIVDFYLVDSSQWYPWWNNFDVGPITLNDWDTAFIPVPANFLDNGFQFRFRNKASLSGALDHWHVDYVQLYENPLLVVQEFKDLAIAYPMNTLLDDYTSVPWDHYLNLPSPNDQMQDTSRLQVWNSDVDATNVGLGMFLEISYDGSVQNSYNLPNPGGVPGWTSNWELAMNNFPFFTAALHPFFDAPGNDSMATFDIKINCDAAVAASNVYVVNDTNYFQQKFQNYYAYDDGSAEVAYGISGSNSQLAYEFNAFESDTLKGVLFHFVPSVTDVSGNIMLLTVWDDNNGEPGNILYQDDFFTPHYPEYSGSKNGFGFYTFLNPSYPEPIIVPEKFYVGWEQIDAQPLNIGMDRNIVNNDKIFYNVSGTWQGSSQPGSLMMRPVFSTNINNTLSVEEKQLEEVYDINMFPNPATDMVTFMGLPEKSTITLYDMSGRAVYSETISTVIDIDFLQTGVYIVDIRDNSGLSLFSDKLIKK